MIRFYLGRASTGFLWLWDGGGVRSLFALETVSPQHPEVSRHSIFMGKEKELKVCTRMKAVRQDSCEGKTTQGLADQGEAFQLYSRSRGLADWLPPG